MPAKQSATTTPPESSEVDQLRAEVTRLRELVGPSEESYVKLRLDLLGARDAAMGAEAEAGRLKGHCLALEAHIVRLDRDQIWFRQQVVMRLKHLKRRATPSLSRVVSKLAK